jgi:hypothetical protein
MLKIVDISNILEINNLEETNDDMIGDTIYELFVDYYELINVTQGTDSAILKEEDIPNVLKMLQRETKKEITTLGEIDIKAFIKENYLSSQETVIRTKDCIIDIDIQDCFTNFIDNYDHYEDRIMNSGNFEIEIYEIFKEQVTILFSRVMQEEINKLLEINNQLAIGDFLIEQR